MKATLPSVRRLLAQVYLDDIVIILRSPRDHIHYWKHVSSLLRDAVVAVKLEKYNCFTRLNSYHAHVLCLSGLEYATHTTDAIKGLQ